MNILRGNDVWGTMQVTAQANAVSFSGKGSDDTNYGEVLRVWGIRDGKAPLLIGVAEPNGERLCVKRTMSTQYLTDLGYYPALPEQYIADTKPPQKQTILQIMLQNQQIMSEQQQENTILLSCAFHADAEFPLAFAFCLCRVKHNTAYLLWDKKTDRPVWRNDL